MFVNNIIAFGFFLILQIFLDFKHFFYITLGIPKLPCGILQNFSEYASLFAIYKMFICGIDISAFILAGTLLK